MGNQSHPATSLLISSSVLQNSFVCCCLLSSRLPPHGPPSAFFLFPFIPPTFCLIYFPIALIPLFSDMFLPSHHPLSSLFLVSLVSFSQFPPSFLCPLPSNCLLSSFSLLNSPFHSCMHYYHPNLLLSFFHHPIWILSSFSVPQTPLSTYKYFSS